MLFAKGSLLGYWWSSRLLTGYMEPLKDSLQNMILSLRLKPQTHTSINLAEELVAPKNRALLRFACEGSLCSN